MSISVTSKQDSGWSIGNSAMRRIIVASLFGTALEAYDFLLYGALVSTIFSVQFFPNEDPAAATLFAFGTFAAGFLARPIGGMIIANYGDRIGRKPMLMLTLSLIGVATFLMGLLPTYAQIGVFAPILLTALRMLQGVSYGGEWGGAVLLVVETAPPEKRGYLGGFPQAGVPLGFVVGSGLLSIVATLSGPNFETWGWRIPFLLGGLVVVIGLYIRSGVKETPEFTAVRRAGVVQKLPILEVLRRYSREVVLTTGTFLFINGAYFVVVVFMVSYGTNSLGLGIRTMLNAVMVGSLAQVFACIGFGKLSDRLGRRPVVMGGVIFISLFVFPLFWLVETRDPFMITLGITITLIGFGAAYGPVAAFFTETFSADVRYTGASMGYQIGSVIGGGFAPLIATFLFIYFDRSYWPICVYVILLGIISIICLTLLKEKHVPTKDYEGGQVQ